MPKRTKPCSECGEDIKAKAVICPECGCEQEAIGFRCIHCRSTEGAMIRTKVSVGGWIIFVLLLFVCFPFCFIGLLMTETYRTCRGCGINVG